MKQGHQRAAARQPDCRLCRGVSAPHDPDSRTCAELTLERPGGVEDAYPLELIEPVNRRPAVFGAGRKQDRAGKDLLSALEPHHVTLDARLQRLGAVGGRGASMKLPRLRDRSASQLGAADPRGKAEVVLDPS